MPRGPRLRPARASARPPRVERCRPGRSAFRSGPTLSRAACTTRRSVGCRCPSQPLARRMLRTRCASAKPNCPGASARRGARFGSSGAAARSAVVMNGFSAGLRQTTDRSWPPSLGGIAKIRESLDGVVEEHHAEARHDQVEARRSERVALRVGADERRGRALLFGATARSCDHRLRDVDSHAPAVRAEQRALPRASCFRSHNRRRALAPRRWRGPLRRAALRAA